MDKKINKKMKSKFEIHITENDEAEDVLKKLLASGMTADEILAKLK